jgi:hypothetical protein
MDGITEINPDLATLRDLIESLQDESANDYDHPDVALIHDDSGWSISYYPNRTALLENLEDEDESPRYRKNVSPEQALEFWTMLADGEIKALLALTWQRRDVL